MKITVGLPSRNRPAGLLSTLTALDALATGSNQITYAVIIDDDDYVTLEQVDHWKMSGMLPAGVVVRAGPRVLTVNARFNQVIEAHPADVYMQACDDAFPLAFQWDKLMAGAKDIPAYSWQECNDPSNATYLVISDRWKQAVGRFYPEYFPFWFADTWVAEVFTLAFAKPIGVVNQLQMGGKRGKTQGMRDLAFWFEFFAETRVERIAEAVKIAAAHGFTVNPETDRAEQLAAMRAGDVYQLSRCATYEAAFSANLGEPSTVYKAAKFRADCWLAERQVAA